MRLAWATDIHLNFVAPTEAEAFCRSVLDSGAEALLVAGDIAEAPSVTAWLRFIEERVQRPMFFVLGNHDYYRGSIADVRTRIQALVERSLRLRWLHQEDTALPLTARTALIGHGAWADGRYGDYANSAVVLNDHLLIPDFFGLDHWGRLRLMQVLAEEAATHARRLLPPALESFEHVIFLTHAPPFVEVCLHDGHFTDRYHLPHFSCKAVGDALYEIMSARPDRALTVLCGHTHSAAEARPLPNMRVIVGNAEYGRPTLQSVLDIY